MQPDIVLNLRLRPVWNSGIMDWWKDGSECSIIPTFHHSMCAAAIEAHKEILYDILKILENQCILKEIQEERGWLLARAMSR